MSAPVTEIPVTPSREATAPQRLFSLDIFRGATIAAMILVNNPGNDFPYAPLEHSKWNGWTPTDLIFPFFLFIVGVSLTLSFRSRMRRGESRRTLLLHSLRRSAIIFLIGLFLNGFPYFHLSTWRVAGVLQRIAIAYLAAAADHADIQSTRNRHLDRRPAPRLLDRDAFHPCTGIRHPRPRHATALSRCEPVLVSRQPIPARQNVRGHARSRRHSQHLSRDRDRVAGSADRRVAGDLCRTQSKKRSACSPSARPASSRDSSGTSGSPSTRSCGPARSSSLPQAAR